MPAHGVLGVLCMVAAGQLTHRHFALHGNQLRSAVCTAELVVEDQIGRVHVGVVSCLQAALTLALVQLVLVAIGDQLRVFRRLLPLAQNAVVLILAIGASCHRRIQLTVNQLHGLVGGDSLLAIEELQRLLVGHTLGEFDAICVLAGSLRVTGG